MFRDVVNGELICRAPRAARRRCADQPRPAAAAAGAVSKGKSVCPSHLTNFSCSYARSVVRDRVRPRSRSPVPSTTASKFASSPVPPARRIARPAYNAHARARGASTRVLTARHKNWSQTPYFTRCIQVIGVI